MSVNNQYVQKVWGAEVWHVHTELYCCKSLLIVPGFQCSLHRHLLKDETFLMREGSIILEVGEITGYLYPGDSQRVLPGTWHRFKNVGPHLAILLEVSTHHDDADVERKEESKKIR